MKKIEKCLFFLLMLFSIGVINVNAKSIDVDNIPEDTYVIGTHLFNRESNSDYQGYLNTKAVMLAAKTISSDSLDKMIIYYKNIDGEWVDGLTSKPIEVPHYFEINYINTRVVLDKTPYVYSYTFGGPNDYVGNNPPKPYKLLADLFVENLSVSGMEIYYSETIDGNYKLLEDVTTEEIYDDMYVYSVSTLVEIEKGKTFYYKVRFFKLYGEEKVYSVFSDPVECENDAIELDVREIGYDAYNNLYSRLEIDAYGDADGIEVEYKATNQSSFEVIRKVPSSALEESEPAAMLFYTAAGMDDEIYRVRPYKNTPSGVVYGSYSNKAYMANWIPQIRMTAELSSKEYDQRQTLIYTYGLEVEVAGEYSGIELYSSDTVDGEYTQIATETDNIIFVKVPAGTARYYKAKIYHETSGGKVTSEYSNVVDCTTQLTAPYLSIYEEYFYDEESYESGINDVLEVKNKGVADKIEVYYSTNENGEYKLIKTVDASEDSISILQNETTSNYYKVRLIETETNQTSEFSNIVSSNDMDSNLYFDVNYIGYIKYDDEQEKTSNYVFEIEPSQLVGASGFEVYLSETGYDEDFRRVKTTTESSVKIYVESGSYYVKIRKFKTFENTTEYSYHSDYQTFDTYDKEFKIEANCEGTNDTGVLYELSMDNFPIIIENLEFLVSDSVDGEFVSIGLPKPSGHYVDGRAIYTIEIPKGTTKYYKAKASHGMGASSVYISNTLKLTAELDTPVIDNIKVISTTQSSVYLDLKLNRLEMPVGQALYTSETVDGEYVKIAQRDFDSSILGYEYFKVKQTDIKKYFKVKTYFKFGNDIIYSDFSDYTEKLIIPIPNLDYYGEDYNSNCYSYKIYSYNNYEGISTELYASNGYSDDFNFKMIEKVNHELDLIVDVPANEYRHYKARSTVEINGINYYSDFSDVLILEGPSILTPSLFNPYENEEKKYTGYEDGYYIYDLAINFSDYLLDDGTYSAEGYDVFKIVEGDFPQLIASASMGGAAVVKVSVGETITLYARAYVEYNGEKIYSDYSNDFELGNIESNFLINKISKKHLYDLLNSEETSIFYFYLPGCVYCNSLFPKLEEVAVNNSLKVSLFDINLFVDNEFEKFFEGVNVTGVPVIVITKSGEIVDTLIGDLNKSFVVNFFEANGLI